MNNEGEQSMNDKTTIHVAVNPNGEFLGELVVNYKETGESIPVTAPLEEFRKAIQEEIDAAILEAIHKAVRETAVHSNGNPIDKPKE